MGLLGRSRSAGRTSRPHIKTAGEWIDAPHKKCGASSESSQRRPQWTSTPLRPWEGNSRSHLPLSTGQSVTSMFRPLESGRMIRSPAVGENISVALKSIRKGRPKMKGPFARVIQKWQEPTMERPTRMGTSSAIPINSHAWLLI
ncbi:hypothetical protein PTTG_30982, partial [Puccinia triticina 1-1 BBBD Race 1]